MQPAMKFGGGAPFQVGMTPWSPNPDFTVISFISLEKRERSNYVFLFHHSTYPFTLIRAL